MESSESGSSKSGSGSDNKSTDEDDRLRYIYRYVLRLYPKTIVLTQYSGKSRPFNWIWHIRNYGKAITAGTSQKGTADWNGNKLIYQDITLSLDSLRSVIHGLFETVRERLYSELLFIPQSELPEIDLDRLRDQPNLQSLGFNFLKDESNNLSEKIPDPDTWLWKRIFSKKGLRQRFVNSAAGSRDNPVVSFKLD